MYGLPVRYRLAIYVAAAAVLLTLAVASSGVAGRKRAGSPCPAGGAESACTVLTADVDADGRPDMVVVYVSEQGQLCWVTRAASGARSESASCTPVKSLP